ncbi:thioredoxin domain-containing protein [Dyadobacter aurulentus]|uniref:thioredoxin domain-containing protein n=1 Tax=Dyadobacter sp. UC 10 TaxID=2605428 RepID=UPI0011F2241C|nr:thioredoxin domain-containing protein [Dyadobacter sp. UC 10]KAA0989798.1 thioredoxin domain-containing protein [Dyadobacter sp. UC 10]
MHLLFLIGRCKVKLAVLAFAFVVLACVNKREKKVIAEIEGKKIYFEDVDKLVENSIYEYLFAINEVRDITLNQLIDDKLLDLEASHRHVSVDSLMSFELSGLGKIFPTKRYVHENALESGVVDPEHPFELIPIDSKRGENILLQSYRHYLRRKYLSALRIKYHVKVYLSPPESPAFNFDGISKQTRGNLTSKTSLSIVYNFSCNVCQEKDHIFRRLFEKYKDKARFNYFLLSPQVNQSILLADCAGKQGKFWSAHEFIYSNKLNDSILIEDFAAKVGLDYFKCLECVTDRKTHYDIATNMSKLRALEIEVTPTILINNRIYYGEISEIAISSEIEKSL